MPEAAISVLLVDDHSLVRKGFRRLLEDAPGICVVGEASDGHEAVEAVGALKPQVVVMDFALPSMNGAVATRRIRELYPETAVLILSMHAEPSYVRTCLEAGARGYLLKNAMDLELVSAVRRVAAGEQVLDPRLGKLRRSGRGTAQALNARTRGSAADRAWEIEQGDRHRAEAQREYGVRASRQHHAGARDSQHGRAGGLRDSQRAGEHRVTRRTFVLGSVPLIGVRYPGACRIPDSGWRTLPLRPASISITTAALSEPSICPKRSGPGCAFLDYDGDGWLDILLVNGAGLGWA